MPPRVSTRTSSASCEKLAGVRARRLLVLNKIDRVEDKTKLLALAAELNKRVLVRGVFMIAAVNGDGTAELKSYLASVVPEGPWHYPEDDISDAPLRLLASEITREKIYKWLHDELPYSTTVETTAWQEFKNGSVRIEQTIFVNVIVKRVSCSVRAAPPSSAFRRSRGTN